MSQIDIRFFSRSLNRHTSFKMYIPDDKRNYGGVYDKQNMKTLFILHGYTQDGNNWIPEYISEKYNFAVGFLTAKTHSGLTDYLRGISIALMSVKSLSTIYEIHSGLHRLKKILR